MKLKPLLLTIAMLGATACGSSRTVPAGDPIPIDDIVDLLNTTNCELLVRCHVFSETAFCPLYLGATPTGFNSLSAIVASVKAGRTKYDPAAARACIDTIAASACSVFGGGNAPEPEACKRVFAGTLADGARCIADTECVAGSFCATPANDGCDGTCTRGGTMCNEDEDCSRGQWCDRNVPTATSQGTCVTPTAPGAANQPCGTKDACAAGLYCKASNDASRSCQPIGQVGDPCTGVIGSCADDLLCVFADDGGTASCRRPAAKGDPCEARGQCAALVTTMACDDVTHTCVDAPASGPCVGAALACNSLSSYCDVSSGTPTCTPYQPAGSACGIFSAACGLPGTALCVATDPAVTTGTCAAPQAPVACLP